MSDFHDHHADGLDEVVRRLQDDRAEATDLELDRAKVHAMSRASRASTERKRGFRPRIVSTLVATGLLAIGAIGIGASSGGLPTVSFTQSSSVNSEYCPESSQQPGKPKDPGPSKCGQPKTK
jgi:hypothetical protein